ncbi:vomeronasal type-2 receptor 26-like [Pleurodeles waltl]|uniref:vomeronasal type-2 receptor 26-like n=1 Tax=Pleurodeles waltl TaxID=8319 RepID=UPI0037099F5E
MCVFLCIDAAVCIQCQEDQWSNERRDSCVPRSIEFLSYGEPLGATLASISTVLSLLNIVILGIFCKYRDTAIIKANNRDLSYLLLVSLMLCFLCSYMFIGRPMKWTCMFRKMAFGLLFSFSVSCILAKTIIVIVAFNATNPTSQWRNWTGPRAPFYIVFCCFTVQLIICAIWVLTKTPHYGINTSISKKLIIQCFDGSVALFYCMLGYMGLLACVSFIVAFFARKLPDSFNEAKYITFSLLVFVSVWVSFIPAYLSTDGKYMVAVEVFAILASNSGLMACIFFPKVNIILLRPECNTKSYLLNKKHIKDKIK